jgi:integrase
VVLDEVSLYLRQRPGRSGLYFQRAVPLDVQRAIGKKVWTIKAGDTQAQARAAAARLLEATDREIAQARGIAGGVILPASVRQLDPRSREAKAMARVESEAWLRGKTVAEVRDASQLDWDTYMTALPSDPDEIDKIRLLPWAEVKTIDEVIEKAALIKKPAQQTLIEWRRHLHSFTQQAGLRVPTFATKEQARAFRDHLLERGLKTSTIAIRINYLSGLWTVMVEEGWVPANIWTGVTKRMKSEITQKQVIVIEPIDEAAEAKLVGEQKLLYLLLRYSGMRLAEAAGLRFEDIRDGIIHVQPHEQRPLKTPHSARQIPLHPRLQELEWEGTGLIMPTFLNARTSRWGGGLVWSGKIGLNPHGLRDHAKQRMRDARIDISVSRAILGHKPLNIGEAYGAISMELKRQAIEVL